MTTRAFLLLSALLAHCALAAETPGAETFATETCRLVLAANGVPQALLDAKTGRDWLAPERLALAAVKQAGKTCAASAVKRDGELWRIEFGASGVQADCRITARPRCVVFELVKLHGQGVEELTLLQLRAACKQNTGWWLGGTWDEQFAVALFGCSDRVQVVTRGNGLVTASVQPEFGMEGQKVALVAAPTPEFLDAVEAVERDCGLPSPRIGGEWAKRSRAVRTSYFFSDLTEANADETIRYAKLGGFEYVMTYDGTWSKSLGSYPINEQSFPRGEESLKATVERCHAAGLKVGLHFLTSFVGKNDPLVRPKPDPRLLKDDQAALAGDIDAAATDIAAAAALTSFPTEGAFYGDNKAGFDVQIDDELIQYRAIGGVEKNMLLRCVRGYAGTAKAPHKAGAKIHHLVERYGCYLADLKTTLKGDISERIAGVINRCGFDMVYFDGGECNGAGGPYWYWVSQQQDDVCRRVARDLLVQGSGGTQWTWHWFARGCCDDFAAIAPKQYLDQHKIADSWKHYTDSFMPADLGWWGFLASKPHQPATTPHEVEYYAVRMLALSTPVSLETNLGALKRNGRTEEMLALLCGYEKLRLSGAVPAAVREKLRAGEWHLVRDGERRAFVPIRYDAQRTAVPGEARATNTFGAQPLKLRLQAVPALAAAGDNANLALLLPEQPMELPLPAAKAPMPGALACRTDFPKPLNLLRHRGLAVRINVEGAAAQPPAVLNIQLEAGGRTYRDHYLDLDFAGEKTVVLPEPNTERMLPEFRPAHSNYAFKAAMYGFDYGGVVALNLRWMRVPKDAALKCRVAAVEALAESDSRLTNVEVLIGDAKLAVAPELKPGDYAEFWAEGTIRVFDHNGALLATSPVAAPPQLAPGENRILLRSATPGAAILTLITTGEPLAW